MRSSHSVLGPATSGASGLLDATASAGRSIAERVRAALEGIAFWSAVVLPFLYVPVLLEGPPVLSDPEVILLLLAANVVALVVGHDYRRDGLA